MSNELLPCPFCGVEATIKRTDTVTFVFCATHECVGPGASGYSDGEAFATWNRRADSQRIQELEVELLNVLDVAIARGVELGYEDEDYHARYQQLTGKEWDNHE